MRWVFMQEKKDTDYTADWDKMNLGILRSGKLPILYQILTH